jgi:hypothetical protein
MGLDLGLLRAKKSPHLMFNLNLPSGLSTLCNYIKLIHPQNIPPLAIL